MKQPFSTLIVSSAANGIATAYHALTLGWEPGLRAIIAGRARAVGAPMLSHDDTQAKTRQYCHDLGATTAEFPMTMGPTQDARDNGDAIIFGSPIFGSPNSVRGGSHIGSLGAADMVEAGLCDAMVSDYHYPAMLGAVARLDREKRADRSALRSLVSAGPGLANRG